MMAHGTIYANVGVVTGAVNSTAANEHFSADTNNLILSGINVSDDPTYYNMGGEVTIASDLVFHGNDLAIVAATNIVTAAGAGQIDTSSSTGNGGNITMIAGANFTSTGAASGNNDQTSQLTITGGTAAGGYIDLNGNISGSGVGITSLTSASTGGNGTGGNITLVAYGGNGASAGQISVPTGVTVTSGGAGTGNNGAVTVVSGANSGNGISIGNINTTGGSGNAGNITLATTNPNLVGAANMTIVDGSITNGTSFTASATANAASIIAGNLTSSGGSITATAGTSLTTGSITSNGIGFSSSGGTITVTAGTDLTTGSISSNGAGFAGSGGAITATAGTNLTTGSITSNGAGLFGSGGTITLAAAQSSDGNLQVNGSLTANGSGISAGGTINVSYSGTNPLLIGASNSADNYINGNINANSFASGNINISSFAPGSTTLAPLNVALTGTIAATGIAAGNVTFNGQTISVIGSGSGNINAVVNNNSSAGAVTYSVTSGNLTLGQISNASGNINVTNSNSSGTITATENIASAGQLNINASGAAGAISVQSGNQLSGTAVTLGAGTGGITFSGTAGISTNSSTGTAGNISVISNGGAVSFGTGSVTANATGATGNGGSITIEGLSFSDHGSVNANATGAGNGGSITVEAVGSTANLAISNTTFNALSGLTSGNGGTVTLSAGQNLSIASSANINVNSRATNGNGGTISITNGVSTAGNLQISKTLTANGSGTGKGGEILISANSNNVFLIGAASSNGTSGNLIANGGTAVGGSGGTISVTNRGTGGITLDSYSNISAAASSGGGSGGSITFNANSGILTLPAGLLSVNANGPGTYNGGSISLTGASINLSGAGTLSLEANGAGSGNGGTITVHATASSITLGNGNGNIALISATGGSTGSNAGNGGSVTITAAQSLTIASSATINVSPLGHNGSGGSIFLTNGSGFMYIDQSLNANGVGTGSGGQIVISNNSSSVFLISGPSSNGVNGIFSANAGNGIGGTGGTIAVTNSGSGGITVLSYADIPVNAGLGGGAGGIISLNANSGVLTVPAGTMSVNANGPGSYRGGSISLTGSYILLGPGTGQTLSLTANGFGSGNGGSIYVRTTSPSGSIILGNAAGNIASISATGGSAGSNAGNGGSIVVDAGDNLVIPSTPNIITVAALGNNGNGGLIELIAGSALGSSATAVLQVDQSINANGVGTGNGGSVSVSYHDPTNPLIVGGSGANSFVNGPISANAGSSGANGGGITITNTAAGPLNVSLQAMGTISANGTNLGHINFIPASGQAITVAGNVLGNGNLIGIVGATGTSVYINPQAANTTLTAGVIGSTSSSGFVMLGVNNGNSTINLDGALTTNGGALSILATGDIGSASGAHTSTTGGAITMIAGGTFTTSQSTNTFTVTGGSTFGGSLNLNSFSSVSTAVSSGNTNGGNITLVAYNGTNPSAGQINLPTNITVTSGGHGTGRDGLVTVISGAVSGSGITIGGVNTTGGTGGGGNITLATAVPLIVSSNGTITIQHGAITNGAFAAGTINPVPITTGALTATAGVITVTAGTNITANGNITSATNTVTLFTNSPTGSISIGGNTVSGGEGVSVTTATLNLGSGAAIIAVNNDLTIQGNGIGNSLTINIPANGMAGAFLEALNPTTGNVVFNSVSNPGSISIIPVSYGGLDIDAGSSSRSITFNGGTTGVIYVPMIHAETGLIYATGASVTIGVNNGLTVQNVTASTGAVSLMEGGSAPGQNLTIYGTVMAATTVTLFEQYSSGITTLGSGAIVIGGTGVSVTTPNLNLGNGSAIVATNNDLSIQGNGSGNSLTINIPTTGNGTAYLEALNPTTGNVVFNSVSNPGSISISQSYTGLDIDAGSSSRSITFNGGTTGVINIPMIHAETGLIYATGASVTIGVNNGLTVQNVTAYTGAVSLMEGGSAPGQNLTIYGTVQAATTVTLFEQYASGITTLGPGAQVTGGTGVSVTTPTLNLGSGSAITAMAGNISIQSDGSGHALFINGVSSGSPASITAVLGNVIFNSSGAPGPITINQNPGTINISADGGSGSVAFNGGTTGAVIVDVNSINGETTGLAASASVAVASGNLYLGSWTTTAGGAGFYNTNGNVTVAGPISAAGQSLALIASANILTVGTPTISTSSTTGNGGAITIIAGAASTLSGDNILNVTGASTTGGSISLGGSTTLNSSSSASAGNGGNITLIAFAGSVIGSGTVNSSDKGLSITAGGNGTSGNVLILAGNNNSAYTSYIGNINTDSGASGGNVVAAIATPIISGGPLTVNTGTITSGSFLPGTPQDSNLYTSSILATGNVTLSSGGNITAGFIDVNNVAMVSGGNMTFTTGGGILTDGGQINLFAGAQYTNNGFSIQISGASSTGGSINIDPVVSFSTAGTSGGNITMVAFGGSVNGSGTIDSAGNMYNIYTGGSANQSGNVLILAVGTTIGNINTQPNVVSAPIGGNVTVAAATPGVTNGGITIGSNAAIASGDAVVIGTPASTSNLIALGYIATSNGNVTLASAGNLTLSSPTNNFILTGGGQINLFAGAAFNNANNTGSTISISGASSTTGGAINIATGFSFISAGASGGAVTMEAYAGSIVGSGTIDSAGNAYSISTGGTGTGTNGNVIVLAVGTTVGQIIGLGGTGGGGNITIAAATPGTTSGGININNGAITGDAIVVGTPNSPSNLIELGFILTQGNVTLASTGNLTFASTAIPSVIISGGGQINLFAGAEFASGNAVSTMLITGGSNVGGAISFQGNGVLSSSPFTANGNGGNITVIAFAGSNSGSGTIIGDAASPVSIVSGGSGSGINGNVEIIAGDSGVTSIANIGSINTTGGTGGDGNIRLFTATPVVSAGGIYVTNAAISSGHVYPGTIQNASINVGTLTGPGSLIIVDAGNSALTQTVTDIGLGSNPGGTFIFRENSTATLEVQAGATNGVDGTINVTGGPNAGGGGGTIDLHNIGTGGIDITNSNNLVFTPGAGGGDGGKLFLNAGLGTLTISAGTLNANAAGPGNYHGGRIDLSGSIIDVTGGSTDLTANGIGKGNGGNIIAETTTGNITLGGVGNIGLISATGGSTNGSTGGNVTVSAGGTLTLGDPIDVSSKATNGNGGSITLAAGSDHSANLDVIFNGASGTNLNTSGNGTGTGGNIALISSENIFLSGANNAPGLNSGGGAINIVAGADFTTTGSRVAITGGSSTGGFITAINGHTPITSAGGNVLMVAYGGSNTLSGGIGILDSMPISTGGTGSGVNGNVRIIAGGSTPSFVNLSTINTVGGSGGGGNVSVNIATPEINNGPVTIKHGGIISGSFSAGTLQTASLRIHRITSGAGNVEIAGGGNIHTGRIITTTGNIFVYDASTANNSLVVGHIHTGSGDITLASRTLGFLDINQNLITDGGDVAVVSGGGIQFTAATSLIDTHGGSITLLGGAAITRTGPTTISVSGANNTNGSIVFSTGGTRLLTANNSANGNGGDVTIAAFAGTSGLGSINSQDRLLTINTGGNGFGVNGNVLMIAGDSNPSFGSYFGNINTAGGGGGGGNVTLAAATPIIINGPLVIHDGAIRSGSLSFVAELPSNIVTGIITTSSGNVTIAGGANVTTGAISTGVWLPTSFGFGNGFGNSGSVDITSTGGALFLDTITTNGLSPGNFAGNITLTSPVGINMSDINANGFISSTAGIVTISTPGYVIGTLIEATGSIGGNGGAVDISSGRLQLTSENIFGNSVDVSSGGGNGGVISITTTSSQTFVIGNGGGTGNGTAGDISAKGVNGGFITLTNFGNPNTGNQIINGGVFANGSTGQGGDILFQGQQPAGSASLITTIDGIVQANNDANNSGIIGFNGGPRADIFLLGNGFVDAGQVIRIGNLNPSTLAFLPTPGGRIFISPSLNLANSVQPPRFAPTVGASPLQIVPAYENLSKTDTDYTPFHRFPYIDKYKEPYQLAASRNYRLAAIPGTKVYKHTFDNAQLNQLAKEGLILASNSGNNYLNIDRGNALFAPKKNIVVGTHEGNIYLSPGAIAFVMESGHDVVLYDLCQNGPKQVSVIVNQNKHKVFMQPGLMLVLTRQNAQDFEDIDADCHNVNYRNAKLLNIDEKDVKVFMANFSTSSAVLNVEPLQELLSSADRQDKTVLNEIAKSAVIMGGFSTEFEPAAPTQLAAKQEYDKSGTQAIHPPKVQIGTKGQVTR